jgi:hypothetical protein
MANHYTVTNIKDDTQKLIDYSVDFAFKLLTDYQEFYPFAGSMSLNGIIAMESGFDGNDHPLSQDLMNALDSLLEGKIENHEIRAYALTYDVKVKRVDTIAKIDAIAVKIKHAETKDTRVYYFAYRMAEGNKVEHLDSWSEIIS